MACLSADPFGRRRVVPPFLRRLQISPSPVFLFPFSSPSPWRRVYRPLTSCGPLQASVAGSHRSMPTFQQRRSWPRLEWRYPFRARSPRQTTPALNSASRIVGALARLEHDPKFNLGNHGYTLRRAKGKGASGFIAYKNDKPQPRRVARLLRLPGRALEAHSHHQSHRKHLCGRAPQDHQDQGLPQPHDGAHHGLQAVPVGQQEVAPPGRLAPDRRHHSRRQIQGRRKAIPACPCSVGGRTRSGTPSTRCARPTTTPSRPVCTT